MKHIILAPLEICAVLVWAVAAIVCRVVMGRRRAAYLFFGVDIADRPEPPE